MNDAEVRGFCQNEEYSCHEKEPNNQSERDDRGKWSLALQVDPFSIPLQNPLSTVYLNVIWIDVELPGSCIHIGLLTKNVSVYRNNLEQTAKQELSVQVIHHSKDSLLKVYI